MHLKQLNPVFLGLDGQWHGDTLHLQASTGFCIDDTESFKTD